ncbi:hypothetical protein CB1_002049001 [Camelus ferus]|nr:hypothetical protein CB1_002049001 [Camelus ferus]
MCIQYSSTNSTSIFYVPARGSDPELQIFCARQRGPLRARVTSAGGLAPGLTQAKLSAAQQELEDNYSAPGPEEPGPAQPGECLRLPCAADSPGLGPVRCMDQALPRSLHPSTLL